MFDVQPVAQMLGAYFERSDTILDRLSKGQEHLTASLPSWVLTKRDITLAYDEVRKFFAIRVLPAPELLSDEIHASTITSAEELNAVTAPLALAAGSVPPLGIWLADPRVEEVGNPMAPPVWSSHLLLGFIGNDETLLDFLSLESAERSAAEQWSAVELGLNPNKSVHEQMQLLFNRFSALIRRKSFVERRIHRFIRDHGRALLPAYRRCFFEHRLFSGDEERVADFILQREFAFPALLIELENPARPAFREDGQLSQYANHAREQIREWVQFIDDNPNNRSGDFEFLAGEKNRLVVIGEGLRFIDKMRESARSDTTIWTYDMLLHEAKQRVHDELVAIHEKTGRPPSDVKPFL
jgi:hypothetical protein